MDFYTVSAILGYSIVIAAAIGLVRFKKIAPAYQPFIFLIWLALFNHTLSLVMVELFKSNAVNANVYVLLESILFLWLFKNWGLFKKRATLFQILLFSVIAIWITDNFVLHSIHFTNSLFRMLAAFILIFLSIEQLNILISSAKKSLLFNSCFLICCGIIIYFSYKATIEVFFLVKLKASNTFYGNIFFILVFVNLFVNLIFAWAALWIPKKQKFTLLD